jgi:4-aminobutyrate aminotransferase/(S)-3-amino-2-methylpropionate transaminase
VAGLAARDGLSPRGGWEAPALDPRLVAPVVVGAAAGCWLTDVHGVRYFDASAGSGAVNLGHGYPAVRAACHRQLDRLIHVGWNYATDVRDRLAESLAAFLPLDDPALLFCVTGAEAMEAALKVARAATGHSWVVAFENGYHGKTAGAASISFRSAHSRYTGEDRRHVLFAKPAGDGDGDALLAALAADVRRRAALDGPPAAFVLEPIQGAEGIHPIADDFLRAVAKLAAEVGALLVFDEIYTGFGRTGTRFAAEGARVTPDLLVVGKALGNGLPIAAVAGSRALMEALPHGGHSSTFAAHPVSCAAACAVLEAMVAERPWEAAARAGRRLMAHLQSLASGGLITPPRGRGLMIGFDVRPAAGRPASDGARRFLQAAERRRLLARGGGVTGATIKITPPLLMSGEDEAFLHQAIADCVAALEETP